MKSRPETNEISSFRDILQLKSDVYDTMDQFKSLHQINQENTVLFNLKRGQDETYASRRLEKKRQSEPLVNESD